MKPKTKTALIQLMRSHAELSQAEYNRDVSYNDEHFSAKAEQGIIDALNEEYPEIMDLFLKEDK